ncbi:hypothetical protein C8R45DRAFT_1174895 [Mycena sanguinolenta]|nr:hypothetical protein C8R45DRAFT_1174895 [Mycena sanguinolenta]
MAMERVPGPEGGAANLVVQNFFEHKENKNKTSLPFMADADVAVQRIIQQPPRVSIHPQWMFWGRKIPSTQVLVDPGSAQQIRIIGVAPLHQKAIQRQVCGLHRGLLGVLGPRAFDAAAAVVLEGPAAAATTAQKQPRRKETAISVAGQEREASIIVRVRRESSSQPSVLTCGGRKQKANRPKKAGAGLGPPLRRNPAPTRRVNARYAPAGEDCEEALRYLDLDTVEQSGEARIAMTVPGLWASRRADEKATRRLTVIHDRYRVTTESRMSSLRLLVATAQAGLDKVSRGGRVLINALAVGVQTWPEAVGQSWSSTRKIDKNEGLMDDDGEAQSVLHAALYSTISSGTVLARYTPDMRYVKISPHVDAFVIPFACSSHKELYLLSTSPKVATWFSDFSPLQYVDVYVSMTPQLAQVLQNTRPFIEELHAHTVEDIAHGLSLAHFPALRTLELMGNPVNLIKAVSSSSPQLDHPEDDDDDPQDGVIVRQPLAHIDSLVVAIRLPSLIPFELGVVKPKMSVPDSIPEDFQNINAMLAQAFLQMRSRGVLNYSIGKRAFVIICVLWHQLRRLGNVCDVLEDMLLPLRRMVQIPTSAVFVP